MCWGLPCAVTAQVERLTEQEALALNLKTLDNQQATADLLKRLHMQVRAVFAPS
jgi:hypothetical protein